MSSTEMSETKDSESWYVECSDEEVYKDNKYVKGQMKNWQPAESKDIIDILETIDKNGAESIKLDWTCHARRPLTPATESEYSDSDNDESAAQKSAKAAAMDFDFEDDLNSTPMMSSMTRKPGQELKGSARKRTTDYKAILSNIERQRKLDVAEKTTTTPTSSKQ